MRVLSLFDGMSCGRIALERASIQVDKYYSSEIKDHALKVQDSNWGDIVRLGDVTKVDFNKLKSIDLLIGGSPCQDFSRGNKQRKGLGGDKSSLFYYYLDALKVLKPSYFLLENVVMEIEDNNYITSLLGVQPVRINSSLVSAQLRDRYYWTNIPGLGNDLFGKIVEQPKDRSINLNDVLDDGYCPLDKARCLLESDSRRLTTPIKMFHRFYSTGFTTLIFKSKEHYEKCKWQYDNYYGDCSAYDIDEIMEDDRRNGMYDNTFDGVRYMNQREMERCQTVPEGYTDCLTRDEAACLLGDGWTIDVISHLLQGLKNV